MSFLRKQLIVAVATAASIGVVPAAADPAPKNYVVAFAGTTLLYRPPGGPAEGLPGDFSPGLGYARQLTPELALELDVGPSYNSDGKFAALVFTPSLVYVFHPHLYGAMRFVIPTPLIEFADTYAQWNLGLSPGIGAYWPATITPIVELDVVSFVGRGDPDLGLSLTAGALYAF